MSDERTSFVQICAHGGQWCRACQRYVIPDCDDDHGRPRRCPHCHSVRLRWDPPLEGFNPNDDFKTDPKNCRA